MFHSIFELLRNHPSLAVFLAVGIGYFIGKIKFYNFNLGSTAGVLIAALIIGQIDIQIPGLLKTVAFSLFIFTIGYKVGPEFFGSLKAEGIKYILLSFVVAIVGLITALILGKFLHFDPGTTAGLLGGGMTQSAVIGTADGAIKHLAISAASKVTMESNVAIAYAITYIFGTAGLILFFKLIPKLMRIDLKAESLKLKQAMSGGTEITTAVPELFFWSKRINLRAYKVENPDVIGKTVQEIENMFTQNVEVDRIIRAEKIVQPEPNSTIQTDDIITLIGKRETLTHASQKIGAEVSTQDAINITGEILEICVLNKDAVGKTLEEISQKHGHGCFLKKITRQNHEIPITHQTTVKKCDVWQVAGSQEHVEALVKYLGYPERQVVMTDLVMVGIGCFLGTLLGLAAVPVFGIPVTLGVGGGVLVSGLIFGWLRGVHPTFGQIPTSVQWIFVDLGLNLFIACVGLIAGPKAIHAIQTSGPAIFFAGIIMTLMPMILGLLFGKFILKINPVLLFGALTGAGTVTAALNALKEESDSSMPALGYTVPYAFGNVLLTIWGTLLVYLMR
ncbi:MAG: aspartate-alanine antiporter [Gammaproteobacteria bacterium]